MQHIVALLLAANLILAGCDSADRPDPLTAKPTTSSAPSEELPASSPFADAPHEIPGLIEAEHYDQGPPDVAYHDNDQQNLGVDYRTATQVDIEQRDDASNGHGVGWTRTGEWLNYSVNILEAGEYKIEIPVASNRQGGVFHLEIDGTPITGPIKVPDTGGWKILKTISATTIPLEPGEFVVKMVMDEQGESGSIGDIDYLRFVREMAPDKSAN